jgi:hypothetical protein
MLYMGTSKALKGLGKTMLRASHHAHMRAFFSLTRDEKRATQRLEAYCNKHRGRRCFVIGNGPSLSNVDLRPLKDELTFVMSGFWRHPILNHWQPTYYFFADPLFFDGSAAMQSFFASLRQQVHGCGFFVPAQAKRVIEVQELLPAERTNYVAFHGWLEEGLQGMPDLTKAVPCMMGVSQFAILAAMYMGCSPIYLLGMDHDWLTHRGNDRHFYQGKTVENHSAAHGELARYSYRHMMESTLSLWRGYHEISRVAKENHIQILNATSGGFLDVFPRVSPEQVLAILVSEGDGRAIKEGGGSLASMDAGKLPGMPCDQPD